MVRRQPRWPQQPRSRLVDSLIDALVTQPHPGLLGELHPQMTADLLRPPPLVQKLCDHLPQLADDVDPSPMIASATDGRATVGIERTIAPVAGCVAAQLTRDRRGCPTQPLRDLPDAPARVAQIRDLDPLLLRHEPRADLTHRQPLQRRHKPDHLTMPVGLVATGPVVPRRPGNTDLTSSGQDAPPPFTQLQEPLTLGRLRTPPRPLPHTTRRRQHNLQNLGGVATDGRNHLGRTVVSIQLPPTLRRAFADLTECRCLA